MSLLLKYSPKNDRERELRDMLIVSINNLRKATMPRLLMDIHLILNYEDNVSDEFKELVKSLIPDPNELVNIEGE